MAIRSYGPGKYDTVMDSYVYELTMDGADEELGSVDELNHFALVKLGRDGLKDIARVAKEQGGHLTLEEARRVRRSYGAIVETNDQGFVNIGYYSSKAKLDKEWKKIEKAYEEYDAGRDD